MTHRRIPSYRLHKPSGQAVVRLDGKDHYLGKFGTPTSREAYDRVIAEWLTRGRLQPAGPSPQPSFLTSSIGEVILAYCHHCQGHYRTSEGKPTGELDNIREALRPLRRLYE